MRFNIYVCRTRDPSTVWKYKDPSHGRSMEGLTHQVEARNWVNSLSQPSKSPGLNAIDGIFNLLK